MILVSLLLATSPGPAKAQSTQLHRADILVSAEFMVTGKGHPFGIRAEVMNPTERENLFIYAPAGISSIFYVNIVDTNGFAISPIPTLNDARPLKPDSKHKHVVIPPGSSHFFRIPLPSVVRENPLELNNMKVTPIRAGKYRVMLWARGIYFTDHNAFVRTDATPAYKPFRFEIDLGETEILPQYTGE